MRRARRVFDDHSVLQNDAASSAIRDLTRMGDDAESAAVAVQIVEQGEEHFVDGVTESLTTDLSRIRRAVVIGRNTAFTYKGKHVDLKQIGRELNVRYVLEGSVQRGGKNAAHDVELEEIQPVGVGQVGKRC